MKTIIFAILRRMLCLVAIASVTIPLKCLAVSREGDRLCLSELMMTSPHVILNKADSAYKAKDNHLALSLYMLIIEQDDDKEVSDLMDAYLGAGNVMMRQCNYASALSYYVNGLKICENRLSGKEKREWAAEFYKDIGNVYSAIDDYEQGIHYYELALQECDATTNPELTSRIMYNLAGFNTYVGQPEEARRYLNLVGQIKNDSNSDFKFLNIFINGMALSSEGRNEEAIEVLKDAACFAIDKRLSARYACSAWQHLYMTYDRMGMPDSSFKYMKMCEEYAADNGILPMFPNLLNSLSEYHMKRGDMQAARDYRYKFLHMRDSLSNEREFDAVKNVQMQYESQKTAEKIRRLHDDRKRQQNMLLGMSIGIIALTCFLIYIFRQNKKLMKSYSDLYKINKDFAEREEEMRGRHKADSQEIKRLMDIISDQQDETSVTQSGELGAKYRSSNLNDAKKDQLAASIDSIMENGEIYRSPDFSLDSLAEEVGSNSKYVSQTINEAFGKNFSSYVNDYRVRLACRMITDPQYSNLTVLAIGESVGFKSQSSFTSVFRKHTGLTPSMYRKMSEIDKNIPQKIKKSADS